MSYQVILGLIDPGEQQVPFPLVALDCPHEAAATGLARLTALWQNGQASFESTAPSCYFGDSFFRVAMRPLPASQDRALEVWGRAPHHLTHVLWATGRAQEQEYQLFQRLHALTGSYTLTLAVAGQVRLDLLHLVKYVYHDKRPRALR